MRIVLLTVDQPNQKAFAQKLAAVCEISAIVLSRNVPKKKKAPREATRILLNRLEARLVGRPFISAWNRMLARYEESFLHWPSQRLVRVANVNDVESVRAIEGHASDYVFVSGTNMVGAAVVKAGAKRGGIVNLHTGLSPYVKGGPNCTNWCLAQGYFHLIGNTVMWLDSGIDTGQLIASERTPVDGAESLEDLHWKVMEHGHDLSVRVARSLSEARELPCVLQNSIAEGETFYARDWTATQMVKARLNFRRWSPLLLESAEVNRKAEKLRLYPVHR